MAKCCPIRVKEESVKKRHVKKSHIWVIFYAVNESSKRQRIIKRASAEKATSEKLCGQQVQSRTDAKREKKKWPKHEVAK